MKMLVSWFCPLYMGDCLLSLANLPTGFGIWVSRYMDLYISIYILTVLQCSMLQCVTVYIFSIYISLSIYLDI